MDRPLVNVSYVQTSTQRSAGSHAVLTFFAKPRSPILTYPSESNKMFSGCRCSHSGSGLRIVLWLARTEQGGHPSYGGVIIMGPIQ